MALAPPESKTTIPVWLVMLLVMGLGGGTSALYNAGQPNPRPDPWTGEDAARDRQASLLRDAHQDERFRDHNANLQRAIRTIERDNQEALGSIREHTSGSSGRIARITALEHELNMHRRQYEALKVLVVTHQKRSSGAIQEWEKRTD